MFDLTVKFLLVVMAVAVFGVFSANAQISSGSVIKADIPTSFVVNDKVFPAGTYTIERVSGSLENSSYLVLRGKDSQAMIFDTFRVAGDAANDSALVFDSAGGEKYLSRIIVKGDNFAYGVPLTKTEARAVAKNEKKQTVPVVQTPGF